MDAGAEQMPPLYFWVDQLDVGQVGQGPVLGEGSYGVVRSADTAKHGECALKLVRPDAEPEILAATVQEANVMARLNGHRFVLKLLAAVVEPGDPPRVIGYLTKFLVR
jgi:serine/threonine protein kinase